MTQEWLKIQTRVSSIEITTLFHILTLYSALSNNLKTLDCLIKPPHQEKYHCLIKPPHNEKVPVQH